MAQPSPPSTRRRVSRQDRPGAIIEFVNHASFILEFEGKRIINDPWLFGSAFNDGWDLTCDYPFDMERFREIDYIWISHEHPDHFSPAVLKSIPEELRKSVTVIFQKTKDHKVIDFCAEMKFRIQELPHEEPVRLADNLKVICGNVPFLDSWILYDCGGTKILNINDCIVSRDGLAADIRKATGNVDLLFTQFSYAAWKGNVADQALRQEAANSRLKMMQGQIEVFQPKWTVPFASFVYFSHEENSYNNDSINQPLDAVNAIADAGSEAVLMYPGDKWSVGSEWANEPALARYEKDYDLSGKRFRTSEGIPESVLVESAHKYIGHIRSRNNWLLISLIRRLPGQRFFSPLDILVHDLAAVYTFSFDKGLVRKGIDVPYDVRMHSSSLDFLFRFDWGYDTLTVNGRFEANAGGYKKMTKIFAVGILNNTGRYVGLRLLVDFRSVYFFLRALRRFALRMRRRGP